MASIFRRKTETFATKATTPERARLRPQTCPATSPQSRRPLLQRVFGRQQPSTYQRCLAVHLYYSAPRGGLS
jgi:hypothetical protein